MKYLIDSDWVADYLKGRQPAVSVLSDLAVDGLAIGIIRYGEMFEGIYYGQDARRHEQGLLAFLRGVRVLPLTRAPMKRFARLRGQLRQQGQLIGDMDLLIAATALEHDLVLVTRNRREFQRVPSLTLHT